MSDEEDTRPLVYGLSKNPTEGLRIQSFTPLSALIQALGHGYLVDNQYPHAAIVDFNFVLNDGYSYTFVTGITIKLFLRFIQMKLTF
jgi:hypothetical protein